MFLLKRLLLALACTTLATTGAIAVAGAPGAADSAAHTSHHADKVTPGSKSKSQREMDEQMQRMRDIHERMMGAKTPQERAALMDEQMKVMQNGMSMMNMMGMDRSRMPMSSRHDEMEKRMDMMQMMMQAMMDRQSAQDRPADK
ncbi:hypothetical protein [Burkholderia cenocepacia]|uniref:hypothetical protein n=1 Tax=Burkholderia cenocepacia TaxID=95486 RepID=UPI00222F1E18|nr:hypothetical protein [Burkholderia cenocepacia]MDS0806292.1 hypothetical protein [Burkholderia cenocepacia]